MTPELKAKELVDAFKKYSHSNWNEETGFDDASNFLTAKSCAIICCDEIIKDHVNNAYLEDWKDNLIKYWQSVKTHIQNL